MKKLIAVMAFAMVSVLSFAQNKFTVGGYFGVPVQIGTYKMDNDSKLELTYVSVGFGIDGLAMFTDRLGAAIDLGFYFPQSLKLEYEVGNTSVSQTSKRKDIDGDLWGFDLIAGCAISIINNSNTFFTVSPGFHFDSLTVDKIKDTAYGIGCKISYHYNIGEMFYIGAGCDLVYDFLCFEENDGNREKIDDYSVFSILPKIGFGVKF